MAHRLQGSPVRLLLATQRRGSISAVWSTVLWLHGALRDLRCIQLVRVDDEVGCRLRLGLNAQRQRAVAVEGDGVASFQGGHAEQLPATEVKLIVVEDL